VARDGASLTAQCLQHGLAQRGVVCGLDAGVQLGEQRVGARVDHDEVAERGGRAQPDLSVGVVQRLQERRLQLRQELLQHHAHLRRERERG
jgi:hypothetical protein